jgi:hypothetical protein
LLFQGLVTHAFVLLLTVLLTYNIKIHVSAWQFCHRKKMQG